MKMTGSGILRRFLSRRVFIPLLAAAAVLFIVLGGYRGIASFAMDEMTGFLVGTGAHADQQSLLQTSAPRSEAKGGPAVEAAAVPQPVPANRPEPGSGPALSGHAVRTEPGTLLAQAALSEAAAAEAAPPPPPVAQDSTAYRKVMKMYTATFLRDPFSSLVQAGKERLGKLLEVSRAKMVGSVWGESGIIALLEDDTGRSYALRVGDRVANGSVIAVTPASVTFTITVFGLTKSVTLELAEEGE
jgi:hypothetical protein